MPQARKQSRPRKKPHKERASSAELEAKPHRVPDKDLPGDLAWTRAIVETAVDGIIIINEEGTVEFFNPAAERMFDYETHEVLGKNVNLLMPEPYHSEHDSYVRRYIETDVPRVIGIGREVQGKRKDGSTFPIELSVSTVSLENRRIFTGIVHDITPRKKAQEEKDKLLRDLNKRNIELTCLYRVEESIRSRNALADIFADVSRLIATACQHPEIARARVIFDDVVYGDPDYRETPWRLSSDVTVGDRTRGKLEVVYLEEIPLENEGPFLKEERGLIDAIATVLGETVVRREAEAQVVQASKLASIGELAAGVGHEINNPLNGILNCAEILITQFEEGTKGRQFSELIRSEAERIARIVHSLLTFSRQEKERHSPARLCDIVDTVLSLSRKRLDKSHVRLHVDVPSELPRIRCRSEQLQQVVMNLLINGLHALDEKYQGSHRDKYLAITAQVLDNKPSPHMRLTVEDHGCGISPTNMQRMFDPFFTTKGRDKGTGLGLSVSDGIVKDHGGTIAVESELGVYTTFHVDLPLNHDWAPESQVL